jgi:hypothetical protein
MQTKTLFRYIMVAATVGVLFTSCKREKDDVMDKDTGGASDNALAEGTYNDVQNMSDEASGGSLSSYFPMNSTTERNMLSTCATVTNDTVSVPHQLTIDFGASNCLCNDGRYRRGIINVSYTGHYRDSAETHTISFTDYYVNDNHVLGTKTVTNNGHNSAGNMTFSIVVNGHIIKADGGDVTWTSNRTREWIAGESTPTWFDDVYLITGTASGTTAAGHTFTAVINTPLRREIGCHHFVSGSLTFAPSGKPARLVDFGTGACDNQATVTISGHTYNITLH